MSARGTQWRLRGWPLPLRRMSETDRERLRRTVLELRDRGLSCAAIGTVFELYENIELTEEQVRRWLHSNGEPFNGAKTRRAVAA